MNIDKLILNIMITLLAFVAFNQQLMAMACIEVLSNEPVFNQSEFNEKIGDIVNRVSEHGDRMIDYSKELEDMMGYYLLKSPSEFMRNGLQIYGNIFKHIAQRDSPTLQVYELISLQEKDTTIFYSKTDEGIYLITELMKSLVEVQLPAYELVKIDVEKVNKEMNKLEIAEKNGHEEYKATRVEELLQPYFTEIPALNYLASEKVFGSIVNRVNFYSDKKLFLFNLVRELGLHNALYKRNDNGDYLLLELIKELN